MDGQVNEAVKPAGFEELLRESARLHGHLCAGQVLGARMAVLGLRESGICDPKGADRKNVMVFVEMDRCAADAIQSATGCSLGKRTLKFLDYGKMAATFVNLRTGRAVRIFARDDSRDKARQYLPGIDDKYAAQLEAYKIMADRDLFDVQEVSVELRPEDMPGRPLRRTQCSICGEYVQDMREVVRQGKVFCRPCAGGGYYGTPSPYPLPAGERDKKMFPVPRERGNKVFPVPREGGNKIFPLPSGERTKVRGGFSTRSVMQKSHNALEVRSKVWIESGGEPVFGRGRLYLLEAIDAHGSINRAAVEVNISFRKAWSHIKAMEERLGIKLVERQAGGKNGGGAVLTGDAREFLIRYRKMDESFRNIADDNFRKIFGSEP